ncbi:MAG: MipA/OmpV family protein [Burkholderiaceae bacterium]
MSRWRRVCDSRRRWCRRAAACLAVLVFVPTATAAERPLWELGVATVAIDQQAYPGSSARAQRQLLLPYGVYRGPWLRADDGQVGLRALSNARLELDLGAAAAIGSSATNAPLRAGMPALGTLVELGPRLKFWPFGRRTQPDLRIDLPVRAVFDLSNGMASRGVTIEPRASLVFGRAGDRWLRLGVSALFGNGRFNGLFYGVAPEFVSAQRPEYDAHGGLVAHRATVSFGWSLGPSWSVGGFVRIDDVAGAVNRDSPLVDARRGWSAGLALTLRLARSARSAATED